MLLLCANQTFYYNHGVVDPDGNRLTYELVNPESFPGQNLQYYPPYSATNPISSNPPIFLDSLTGEMIINPNQQQVTVMAMRVNEYDANDSLIGSVVRDMQVWVISCSNQLPQSSGFDNTPDYTIEVAPGGNLDTDIFTSDSDAADSVTLSFLSTFSGATTSVTSGAYESGNIQWTACLLYTSPSPRD